MAGGHSPPEQLLVTGLGGWAGRRAGQLVAPLPMGSENFPPLRDRVGRSALLGMGGRQGATRQCIVVGVDGSPSSQAAFRWALRQARLTGGEVRAVTAWRRPVAYGYPVTMCLFSSAEEIAGRVLPTAIDEIEQEPGEQVPITGKVVEGNAVRVLLDESLDADLLVVGSRGHGGFVEALLGSTGRHCVHYATCPVVVIGRRGQGPLRP